MRETDRKIAEWLGVDFHSCDNCEDWCRNTETPHYSESDAAAVSLLPELVKRGFHPELYYTVDSEGFAAWYFKVNPDKPYYVQPTIAAAICAAVTELIREGR